MGSIENLTTEQRTEVAKLYFTAAQDAAKEYDQRIFWLVAGVAAAFGYLQSKLPAREEWALPCLLVIGWMALFAALAAIMFSFLNASSTHLMWAKYWLWDDEPCGDRAASSGRMTARANWIAFFGVFLGIGMISTFLLVNYLLGGAK
jgi:hypothetical protein